MIRAFFGHHKCASTYIKDVFIQATDLLGMVPRHVLGLGTELPLDYQNKPEFIHQLEKRKSILEKGDYKTLVLTNSDYKTLAIIDEKHDYRGFHVVRDPRDIVISAYFSHLYSHVAEDGSWWLEFRKSLSKCKNQEEGLLLELDLLRTFLDNMNDWNYENPKVLETRYEVITKDPLQQFSRIFNFLGIKTPLLGLFNLATLYYFQRKATMLGEPMPYGDHLPMIMLKRILDRNSFKYRSRGRPKGKEDTRSHYRKGISGDWRTHFTPSIKAEFKNRYNDLLIKLDYEQNEEW